MQLLSNGNPHNKPPPFEDLQTGFPLVCSKEMVQERSQKREFRFTLISFLLAPAHYSGINGCKYFELQFK